MGLIDNDGIIGTQIWIALGFGQQDAVGHHLYIGIPGCAVFETNFIANGIAELLPQFFGDAAGNRGGGDSSRLGAPDQPVDPSAGCQAKFRQLGGLAGTGFT